MDNFYAVSTAKHQEDGSFYEKEIRSIVGCALKRGQEDCLNVLSFSSEIFEIFKQIYYMLYQSKISAGSFKYVTMQNIKIFSEPVVYIKRPNYVLHVFNYSIIAKYFDSSIEDIEIREILETKQRAYTFKDNAKFVDSHVCLPPLDSYLLNELQETNVLKLYILADHALEHLYINNGDPELNKLDLNHKRFGTNNKFLSGLITNAPSHSNEALLKNVNLADFKQLYDVMSSEESEDDE